jgi:WS/DGAT/MGAT family acyltransferase
MFYRIHHSLADGIALARVMLSLTDPSPEGHDPEDAPPELARYGVIGAVVAGVGKLARGALSLPALPVGAVKGIGVARKLLLDVLPTTLLSAEPGPAKLMAWSQPRPLDEVKAISRATGTTVNDVLVTALSGSLAGYLAGHGQAVDHLTTMVPVNIRPPDQPLPRELGNKFALVLLHLPTGALTPRDRLKAVHRRMDAIKHSPEALITAAVAEGIGHVHRIEEPLVDFFAGKAIGVTTNVIGPTQPRYLAGVEVAGVLGWVPGSGGQTLGVCIFSYAGTVRIGFKVDAATVPSPEQLVVGFDAELDALGESAGPVVDHGGPEQDILH